MGVRAQHAQRIAKALGRAGGVDDDVLIVTASDLIDVAVLDPPLGAQLKSIGAGAEQTHRRVVLGHDLRAQQPGQPLAQHAHEGLALDVGELPRVDGLRECKREARVLVVDGVGDFKEVPRLEHKAFGQAAITPTQPQDSAHGIVVAKPTPSQL